MATTTNKIELSAVRFRRVLNHFGLERDLIDFNNKEYSMAWDTTRRLVSITNSKLNRTFYVPVENILCFEIKGE